MVCRNNFCDYDSYYSDQAGGKLDISYYRGLPYQRGSGIFSSFAKRFGVPALKYLFKRGVSVGKDILTDVAAGKSLKESTKSSFKKGTATALKDLSERLHPSDRSDQTGTGLRVKPKINIKKRKSNKSPSRNIKSKVKRRKSSINSKTFKRYDIFK